MKINLDDIYSVSFDYDKSVMEIKSKKKLLVFKEVVTEEQFIKFCVEWERKKLCLLKNNH
jgi:hypothetical protein